MPSSDENARNVAQFISPPRSPPPPPLRRRWDATDDDLPTGETADRTTFSPPEGMLRNDRLLHHARQRLCCCCRTASSTTPRLIEAPRRQPCHFFSTRDIFHLPRLLFVGCGGAEGGNLKSHTVPVRLIWSVAKCFALFYRRVSS